MKRNRRTTTADDGDSPPLSDEALRRIARIRRQIDEELGVAPDPPRSHNRWRRPLLLVLLGLAVASAGGIAGRELLSASWTREPSQPAVIARPPTGVVPESPAAAGPDATLPVRSALDTWIEATQRGDIATQMSFYPAVVPVFYTWHNAPREAILAEKQKVFGAASMLDIRTGAPTITVAADGNTAITRFRKAYRIEGPHVRRRGVVVQELRWVRTPTGWKITSERDAAVLADSSRRGASAASQQRMTGRRARATTDISTSNRPTDTSMVGGSQTP